MKPYEIRENCVVQRHEAEGACFNCCASCNFSMHRCHFCGTELTHDSRSLEKNETGDWVLHRHWLSDCRPDLVQHEPGPICTWAYSREEKFLRELIDTGKPELATSYRDQPSCYAYQDSEKNWTDQHVHFYPDGPMA